MDLDEILRKIAKSNKYQTLYTHYKEAGCPMFRNNSDFTAYQIYFINLLNMYYNLYNDIATDYVDEIVLNNSIFEDAYLYYKSKTKLSDIVKSKTPELQPNTRKKKGEKINTNSFSWVFKQK
jgi:hypothetical protein